MKKIKVSKQSDSDMPSIRYYPLSFSVDAKQMPEIKNWEVGKKYRLMIEVEQKFKNKSEDSLNASFEIIAYEVIHKKSINEMTDEEFGEYQGESLAKGELV